MRVRCLSDGGAAGVRPLHARDPRHFTRVSGVHLCVCARMAVLLSAKCILGAAPRGGGGVPAALQTLVLV